MVRSQWVLQTVRGCPASPASGPRPCPRAQSADRWPVVWTGEQGLASLAGWLKAPSPREGAVSPESPPSPFAHRRINLITKWGCWASSVRPPTPQYCTPSVCPASVVCCPVPWGLFLGQPTETSLSLQGGTEATLVKCPGSRGHLWQVCGGLGSLGLRVPACPGQRDHSRGCLETLPCPSGKVRMAWGAEAQTGPPHPPGVPWAVR